MTTQILNRMTEDVPGMKLVLVCDSSSDVKLKLVPLLGSMGFRAVLACNGKEGLALIRRFNPDMVISDIDMPEMDGIEMLQAVRGDFSRHEEALWVLMGPPDLKGAAMQVGRAHFLEKPFTASALKSLVKSAFVDKVAPPTWSGA